MAVIMGRAYPDLYAAVGVHSGIPYAAAHNANSAFAVMKGAASRSRRTTLAPRLIPTIVLHGDNDKTVHPSNGETLARQFSEGDGSTEMEVLTAYEQTRSNGEGMAGAHAYTRTIARDKSGKIFGEYWLVHGAGHAWFGGNPAASHTDASGPDASSAMSRFFLEHQLSPKHEGR